MRSMSGQHWTPGFQYLPNCLESQTLHELSSTSTALSSSGNRCLQTSHFRSPVRKNEKFISISLCTRLHHLSHTSIAPNFSPVCQCLGSKRKIIFSRSHVFPGSNMRWNTWLWCPCPLYASTSPSLMYRGPGLGRDKSRWKSPGSIFGP